MEDVHFAYKEKEVLHGVDLVIKEGTVNALVGPSGSGKSTIAKLIASFWDVGSGKITLGGTDIRKIPLDDYQKQIAYVSQDNYLFDMSVMENIRLGDPKATDEQVMEAARSCGCHEFILGLENGYDTVCGGSGSHLSGGERQRISIARAMLKNAPIVILDEATAYTDPENEALVQRSVAKLVQGRTLLVIAHRLSTIASADQIILINDGRVEERGTQEELLASSELYRRMWQAHIAAKEGEDNA
jgi:ATP-binding cassette subfamily B protein